MFSFVWYCLAHIQQIELVGDVREHRSAVYVAMVVVVCIPYYNGKLALAFY